MLKVGDKVYLHIKELDVAINVVGFNIDRLCVIKEIKPMQGNDGLFILESVNGIKQYKVMANDKIWKLTDVDTLAAVVKASEKYDTYTKETILEEIYK